MTICEHFGFVSLISPNVIAKIRYAKSSIKNRFIHDTARQIDCFRSLFDFLLSSNAFNVDFELKKITVRRHAADGFELGRGSGFQMVSHPSNQLLLQW